MQNKNLILLLKSLMITGISLILLGIYFHLYNSTIEAMGITGIIISAACVAVGMILSIPTKNRCYLYAGESRNKTEH